MKPETAADLFAFYKARVKPLYAAASAANNLPVEVGSLVAAALLALGRRFFP